MRPVRLQIPAEAGFIDVVRICLTGVAAKRGFAYEDIEDMKVAVSEACSNAVLHGGREAGGEAIDITFEQTDEGLTVRIVNYGLSFDHAAALQEASPIKGESKGDLRVGGLGIYLMEALMDEVRMSSEEGKTEVVLTKYLGV
ncbi:ATP-binding protein [Paenibacillus soyae]|uniref:ATP-binding protein n=1 Tax=Paenibacillus soyae TaxID=2969249 RepID=A0A9X2MUK5_9BACL|nr:ATP-binding protein [Paenibacillus soyae]MCR2806549.1 ATP-binding protein [Paenibacillus soyae]